MGNSGSSLGMSLRAARSGVKYAVRRAGVASSGLRPAPDFLIIGTKRGGTTSFYYDLLEHPGILRLYPPSVPGIKPEATKGAHYFDSNFMRGERWYRSYMPTRSTRSLRARRLGYQPVVGEASPYYLFHPAAAARAHDSVPSAQILVLLRDPVMRTYSHWKERRRAGAEALELLEALEAEPDRLRGERDRVLSDPCYCSYAWEQQSYATQSNYADALRPWIGLFGRERVLAIASEDYYADPGRVLGVTHEFLGLPPLPTSTGRVRNAARGDGLPEQVQRMLESRFAGPNADLAQLLGTGLPWIAE